MESFSEALRHERSTLKNESKKKRTKRMRKFAGSLALSAVTAAGIAGFGYLNKSGEHKVYPATEPKKEFIDSDVRIISWNVANRAIKLMPQIRKMIAQENPDVIALQEVNTQDADMLQYELPHWNVVYGLADTKQQLLDGGYGDVLMSRDKLTDVESVSIKGSSALGYTKETVLGLGADLLHGVKRQRFTLKNAKNNEQENREALAATIKIRTKEEIKDARIITTHIGAGEEGDQAKTQMHLDQFKQLLQIIKDNNKGSRPTFLAGDLNDLQGNVVPAFNNIGFTVREPKKRTSRNNPIAIDFFASHAAGYGTEKVLNYKGSDHFPIEGEWNMDDPSINFPDEQPDDLERYASKG